MPLLKFTPADIQKSKLLTEGWYGLVVKGTTEWIPAKPKEGKPSNSLNLTITFVVEGENDKEVDLLINSQGMGFHVGFFAAVMGIPAKNIQDKPALLEEFDTDTLPGKKVDGHIVVDSYLGRNNNKVMAFLPYGQGRAQAAKTVY